MSEHASDLNVEHSAELPGTIVVFASIKTHAQERRTGQMWDLRAMAAALGKGHCCLLLQILTLGEQCGLVEVGGKVWALRLVKWGAIQIETGHRDRREKK